MLKEHKSLGASIEINQDFTQAQYETYQENLLAGSKDVKAAAAYNRIMIEAALDAGFLEIKSGSLEKPAIVKWVTLQLGAVIAEALEIPKE